MPRAANNLRFEEWTNCARCGFIHPVSMLSKQLGLLLCSCHFCLDDISNMRRHKEIQEVLSDPTEFESDLSKLQKEKGEVVFP